MKKYDILINSSLIVFSVIFGLVLFEILLQFGIGMPAGGYPKVETCNIPDETNDAARFNGLYSFDDQYGWKGTHNTVQIRKETQYQDWDKYTHNSAGYRDTINTGNRSKIVVLGDSFTYGWLAGDNETYPAVLERSTPNTTILNYGQMAYGTGQQYLLYKNEMRNKDHSAVIVGYVANDPTDTVDRKNAKMRPSFNTQGKVNVTDPPEYTSNRGGDIVQLPVLNKQFNQMQSFLSKNTALYPYLKPYALSMIQDAEQENQSLYNNERKSWINTTGGALDELATLADERDAEVLVVMIPPRALTGGRTPENPTYLYNDPSYWEEQKEMVKNIENNNDNMRVLDIEPQINEKISEGVRIYGKADGHFNETGYHLTARLIHEQLISGGHVSKRTSVPDYQSNQDSKYVSCRN